MGIIINWSRIINHLHMEKVSDWGVLFSLFLQYDNPNAFVFLCNLEV